MFAVVQARDIISEFYWNFECLLVVDDDDDDDDDDDAFKVTM